MDDKRGVDSGIDDFYHEKKGMSPLIATVLLIAFAVALGAMIITWAPTLGERTGPDCSTITMIISPYLCYAENMIKMSIKNTGSAIEAVTLKWVDDAGPGERAIPDSKLSGGAVLEREIPFAKSGQTKISLVPSVEYKGKIVPCDEPVLEVDDLLGCS